MSHTVKEIMDNLRTIHGNFSDEKISEENLNYILESSVKAANSSARQAYSIIIVREKETMKEMGYSGALMLVFCVDYYRQNRLAEYHGFHPWPLDMGNFVTSAVDTTLAVQNAVIAAKDVGIDSLISNCIHRGDIERVYKALKLPHYGCFPLIALVLGYPKKDKQRKKERLLDPCLIHEGTYRQAETKDCARISEKYDKQEIGLCPEKKWKESGHAHYLEWFFSDWLHLPESTQSIPEKSTPSDMWKVLKRAGFTEDVCG